MSKHITIAEVASLAGVHKATVSRALNPATRHVVNRATIERIESAARTLGYVPNLMARGLRTSLSMTVGVIVHDLVNPIFPPVVQGVESYLSPRGYTVLLANTEERDWVERRVFESLVERRVDGFIFATGFPHRPLLEEARSRGAKAVLLNHGPPDVPFPIVSGQEEEGIEAAVSHLAALGHRRIMHLSGPKHITASTVRAEAFQTAMRRIPSADPDEVVVSPELSISAAKAAMDAFIRLSNDLPTAIVAGNDILAVGALRSLRENHIDCPREMSVVGFNDMALAEDLSPPLTTVRVPFFDIGRAAAGVLLDVIESGSQTSETIRLPVSLIVRGSTSPPRAG